MASAEGSDTFEPATRQTPTRVILLVEATAAANSTWRNTRKWLDTILQMMEKDSETDPAGKAAAGQQEIKQEAGAAMSKVPKFQYALVVYATHDRSTPAPVQVSGWTPSLPQLVTWLDGIQFVGGVGSKGTAMAHALAEAIVLSKTPYPGGSKPAAAAASHPDVLSVTEQEPGAHTHLVMVCPSVNPCRLPLVWPCTADTKHALYTSKRYHTFIEKFKGWHTDKTDRVTGSLFGQLEFINGSLASITAGTADVWDLLLSLTRHRLSLSIVSARTPAARSMLELFAYGNACLSGLKQACQRGLLIVANMNAVVYLSPMFVEAQRAFKPVMQKLLLNAKKKQQQHQQQREAQQAVANAGAQAQRQQQQQQQAQQLPQHHQQQQLMQQQPPQPQQQQQQPPQLQQQQWQAAQQAAAGGPRPAMPMQQQQVQGMAAPNPATQQQQQQQRVAVAGQAAGSMPQQQQAPQAVQQQQLYGSANITMNVAAGQPAGMPMQQQQAAAVQVQVQPAPGVLIQQAQAQPQMVMMVQHPQMMMQQPQQMMPGMPGFMPQQQAQQQQMLQQQHMLQQQQQQQAQQQVQMPIAGGSGQQAMAAAAAAAGPKPEKQRQPFWRGPVLLHLPELGMSQQVAADVELTSTAAATMMASWAPRRTMIMTEMITVANIKQYVQPPPALKQQGHTVTRVYYKVMQQHPAFNWLQNQVYARPDKQVILLANITPQLKGLLVVGAQQMGQRSAAPAQVNMLEGQLILSGIGG